MRRFAITDIHGCLITFQSLLDKIAFSLQDELYLLGDFVDRGPDSKGLIDFILHLKERGYKVHCLRGNHDQMMLNAFEDPDSHSFWLSNGGKTTLKSFNAKNAADIPQKYFDFIRDLHYYMEVDNYILVHAGLDFRHDDDPFSHLEAMLWARDWYLQTNYDWLGDRIILHGHTPMFRDEVEHLQQELDQQRILGIDNGCVYADKTYLKLGLGSLCAYDLDSHEFTFVDNAELQPKELAPRSIIRRLAGFWSLLSF